ncbi:MAG: HD domain-containing protein [Candidatus Thermoplasmatota archaeon]|jgi:HD superfamily phosphohydrolase|nr:HD domain-containing protein [Candidatus Thermoplasmatota archaeon]
MIEEHKTIRDPIHGDIKLEGVFLDLLETPEIQRLYNIKQLGFAHLVFPGAHHTRLEHSLGTYHMASKAADLLDMNKNEKQIIACAAFLHDLGHGPFSHTLESILRNTLDFDHVDLTEKLISGEYSIFSSEEKKFISSPSVHEILEKNNINQKEIIDIIRGATHKKPYLSELLNSAIDVDQLDYLVRDAYYTGVAYGMIDTERFLQTLTINNHNLAVKRKGVGVVENILMARGLMYSSVYFHKTVRIAELMLSRAIEMSPDVQPLELFKMTDCELLNNLNKMGSFQHEIATSIKYRKLFKQAYAISSSNLEKDELAVVKQLEDIDMKKAKEREFEEKLKIPEGHVIIDIPSKELHQAEPRINQTDIAIIDDGKIKSLDDFTPVAKAIRSRVIPDWVIMIVTDEKYREIISDNAEKILFK